MKICYTILILIILPAFLLMAQTIDKDMTVDIEFHDISLKQAILDISEKYDVRFSYSDSRLHSDQLVSATFKKVPLIDFLNSFFTAYDINFSIIDNQIVLFPTGSVQANKIKGKVVSAHDGSLVRYANISLTDTNKGTSTNEDGEFEIALDAFPSVLAVSHLAHERKLVYVYEEQSDLTIELEPAPRELAGITIKSKRNKNAYYQMVLKAYEKLVKAQGDFRYGKAFYRQKSSREDRYTEIFEIFYDTKYSANGIQDWSVQEGRYAFQKDKEYDVFLYNKNFTLLSRMFPVVQPATDSYTIPVSSEVKKNFELALNEIINYENRYVAIIDYKPRMTGSTPAPSGQLYIDFEDYSILKITGKFADTNLEIIGFRDDGSDWENYNLSFEMSFIDDQSDNLLLDYIKIDHTFDYYYNKKFIGNIQTSSLLSYYEHYTPARGKKLGGPIDFKSSDMEVIDRVGYNPVFWRQNPIVKRTPVEEKLIMDFEQNEAFGAVFMNNDEEVILLPDSKKTAETQQIIDEYEAANLHGSAQQIYLRLDKYHYLPGDNINFSAYIFDKWRFRPLMVGSVLTVVVKDLEGGKVISKNFDINAGAAYGQLVLDGIVKPGIYHLEAYTNIDRSATFKTTMAVSPFPISTSAAKVAKAATDRTQADFTVVAEGGTMLSGVPTKIVFKTAENGKYPNDQSWTFVDEEGNILQSTNTDDAGIGAFTITPVYGKNYFISPDANTMEKYPVQEVSSSGLSIIVSPERNRSIHLDIYQQPATHKDVFIVSAYRGKVSGIFQAKLQAVKSSIDLPVQNLKPGINELAVMDSEGILLAKRYIFNPAEQPDIKLLSAHWKSKRSNRLELVLQVQNAEGKPENANLSAAGSGREKMCRENCDIRNAVLLDGQPWSKEIDFDVAGDSLHQALDNLLILESAMDFSEKMGDTDSLKVERSVNSIDSDIEIDGMLVAELNVSGGFSSGTGTSKKVRSKQNNTLKNEVIWVPKLHTDSKGVALLEMKVVNKNEKINVNIQGLSDEGLIYFSNLVIDPLAIKAFRK
jgi:hypothetical protein